MLRIITAVIGRDLRLAMRRIAAEDCGVLVYATGHEGRGIGFISALAWPGALRVLERRSPGYDA